MFIWKQTLKHKTRKYSIIFLSTGHAEERLGLTNESLIECVCFQYRTANWDSSNEITIWEGGGQVSWPLLLNTMSWSTPTHFMTYLFEESWHFHHFFSLSSGWLPTVANTAAGCNHWPKLTGLCELLLLHCVLFRNLSWLSPYIYCVRLGKAEAKPIRKDVILLNPYNTQSPGVGHLDL